MSHFLILSWMQKLAKSHIKVTFGKTDALNTISSPFSSIFSTNNKTRIILHLPEKWDQGISGLLRKFRMAQTIRFFFQVNVILD